MAKVLRGSCRSVRKTCCTLWGAGGNRLALLQMVGWIGLIDYGDCNNSLLYVAKLEFKKLKIQQLPIPPFVFWGHMESFRVCTSASLVVISTFNLQQALATHIICVFGVLDCFMVNPSV
jgi:hypothetical protein